MAKLSKTYNILIRLAILVLTFYYLYDQLIHKHDLPSFWDRFGILTEETNFRILLLLVISLIPMNLVLESYKWKLLIRKVEDVSLGNAVKAVLAGISVSMFTPNRVGDYLGRVFILQKANRIQATLITILGNMAQLLTTLIFGAAATIFFVYKLLIRYHMMNFLMYLGIIIAILSIITLLIFFYLNFSAFSIILRKISGKIYNKVERYIKVFAWYKADLLLKVLLISILRALIYSFQFFILLRMFGIQISYPEAMMVISMIYLSLTAVPTIALSELGVRGSVSIFIFGIYLGVAALPGNVTEEIIAASSVLWFLNLVIPAILGIFFIFKLKFFRNNNDS